MPYKSEKIKLSETQDSRRKLTGEQKVEIKELYETVFHNLNSLAKQFGVSKKSILLIVNSESAAKARQYRKENWREFQRKGEEWNATQREHRKYKQKLYLDGKLSNDETD
jgi:Zn-dependent peptidase ImmA (M78 family)